MSIRGTTLSVLILVGCLQPAEAEVDRLVVCFEVSDSLQGEDRQRALGLTSLLEQLVADNIESSALADLEVVDPSGEHVSDDPDDLARAEGARFLVTGRMRPFGGDLALPWRIEELKDDGSETMTNAALSINPNPQFEVVTSAADRIATAFVEEVFEATRPEIVLTWCFTCTDDQLEDRGLPILVSSLLPDHLRDLLEEEYEVVGIELTQVKGVCVEGEPPAPQDEETRDRAEFFINGVIMPDPPERLAVVVRISPSAGVPVRLQHKQQIDDENLLPEDLAILIRDHWDEVVQSH